jgi:hypothetical protein
LRLRKRAEEAQTHQVSNKPSTKFQQFHILLSVKV